MSEPYLENYVQHPSRHDPGTSASHLSELGMLKLGRSAPTFSCSALIEREIVQLDWNQLRDEKTLVLQFASCEDYDAVPDDLVELNSAAARLHRLQIRVAVVCREPAFEILSWADRFLLDSGPGELAFPVIVDSDDDIASSYDMVSADGRTLWGHVVVDLNGKVRQIVRSSDYVSMNFDELERSVAAIADNPC
jgi:alkyl hydroperoxide reductase subunit AhpC